MAANTSLTWKLSGTGISTGDVVGGSLQGTVSVGSDGMASFSITLASDTLTEGAETLVANLFSNAASTTVLASGSITVNDTSTKPVTTTDQILWGTTRSDTITGGNGNDRISGVLASGTTAAAMSRGQIDVLTGGLGADVFVLGDSRGVFYDDLRSGNLGTDDYARITDFIAGEDKLQLRNFKYLSTVSSGNLSLYWDRNGNGKLDTGGRNRDELIAILEGFSSLSGSDILFV